MTTITLLQLCLILLVADIILRVLTFFMISEYKKELEWLRKQHDMKPRVHRFQPKGIRAILKGIFKVS